MDNLYFIETDNWELIKIRMDEILNKHNLSWDNVITYDMEDINISEAIFDLDSYSLFNQEKVVLCKNAIFLTSEKSEINHDLHTLEKYLQNPNPTNILILTAKKCDSKKNITKLVKETCKIVATEMDLVAYVKDKTKPYEIKDEAIHYFLSNTLDNLTNINNELDKLLEFCDTNKKITKEDIDLIIFKKIDCNIYELIDAIINKDKQKALQIYQEMINYGEDVFKIFIALANQIRLIYQVKTLRNLNNTEICNKLKLKNVKQVVALRYKIDKYTSNDLLDYLHRLSIMDEELKTGKSIDKIVFPIFIASL